MIYSYYWIYCCVLTERSFHHQWVLLLLVEHRASMKSFQALWSPAIRLTSFRDLPVFLISSSVVLRHVLFGLPLLLYPWGFQSNAVFSIAPASLHNVCPIQFHFLLFIWISIGFCLVIHHSSSFIILSVHFTFFICLKHLFINVCSLLVIWLEMSFGYPLTLRRRIKSHLLFAGIIRSSPFSLR